jgi:transposase
VVRPASGPGLRRKKGALVRLYTEPPAGSVVVCLDELGPEAAKSFPGHRLIRGAAGARARQEADYGRRGKGYLFGALQPATGEAYTAPYGRRTAANWVDFLEQVDARVPAEAGRVYAILDNLSTHRAPDVLLFSVAHPRWEFVSQPKYAPYLNLIEPWWKTLRSLAFTGRRFETWDELAAAASAATAYWNAHRHPFTWGHRRRHRPRRRPGIGLIPNVA